MSDAMKRWIHVLAATVLLVVCAGPLALAQQPPPPARQSEYVPVDSLPPQEQMPAMPLLVGAYSFVLVMFFAYVISVARRLQKVQGEMARLEADSKRSGRT
jgi:hypothetical protein